MAALGMAPVYLWPLTIIGYAVLGWSVQSSNKLWPILIKTFLFFLGFHLCGLYWVSQSLLVDLKSWWWALPLAFVGLPALCSLFPTIFIIPSAFTQKYKIGIVAISLCMADIARGHILTGFPWNFPIHGTINNDLMMAALPSIGFYGLNSALISLAILFVLVLHKKFYLIGLAIFIAAIWFTSFTQIRQASPPPNNTILVQANIAQKDKWNRNLMMDNLARHVSMSKKGIQNDTPQTIIWPETALSQQILSLPIARTMMALFLKSLPKGSVLVTGFLNSDNDQHFNSLVVFNRQGEIINRYDKHHLVPFGEYMPLGLGTITGFDGFSSGPAPHAIHTRTASFLPLICYEIIFPKYSTAVDNAQYILNITNDAWFGDTAGPYQHLDHARFRAIENRKPVLRVSGNGISGWIDENGVIHSPTNLNKTKIITY